MDNRGLWRPVKDRCHVITISSIGPRKSSFLINHSTAVFSKKWWTISARLSCHFLLSSTRFHRSLVSDCGEAKTSSTHNFADFKSEATSEEFPKHCAHGSCEARQAGQSSCTITLAALQIGITLAAEKESIGAGFILIGERKRNCVISCTHVSVWKSECVCVCVRERERERVCAQVPRCVSQSLRILRSSGRAICFQWHHKHFSEWRLKKREKDKETVL